MLDRLSVGFGHKVTLAMSGIVIQEERTDSECKSRPPLADWSALCSLTGQNMEDHPSPWVQKVPQIMHLPNQNKVSGENDRFMR